MTKVKTKNEQGITLVALIITIIVLIILAAVSIVHMLNLQIIGQAVNGTQDYSAAQYDEKNEMVNIANMIESTIAGVKNNQGGGKDPTPETPPTPPVELPEVGATVPTEGWSVEVAKGLVARDGLAAHMGEIVDYNPPAGGTWRIFYYDNEDQGNGKGYFGDPVGTVYLKRDIGTETIMPTKIDTSILTEDGKKLYYQLNPLWTQNNTPGLKRSDEYRCATMCEPNFCESYMDITKASYAVGGIPVEMFVRAYNSVVPTEEHISVSISTNDSGSFEEEMKIVGPGNLTTYAPNSWKLTLSAQLGYDFFQSVPGDSSPQSVMCSLSYKSGSSTYWFSSGLTQKTPSVGAYAGNSYYYLTPLISLQ